MMAAHVSATHHGTRQPHVVVIIMTVRGAGPKEDTYSHCFSWRRGASFAAREKKQRMASLLLASTTAHHRPPMLLPRCGRFRPLVALAALL